jgi:ABC-2 type transport system permease protein
MATALGAALVTSEVRTGLMQSTLLACPRRGTVLAAKATVVGGVVFAVTLPAATAAYAIGQAMLDDSYATGDPLPALLGVAVAIAVLAVAGVAVGTLVRHTAGAVVAAVAVVLLPGMVAPLFGDARRWVAGASLTGVLQKLSQSSDATAESVGTLGAWPSLAAVAAGTTVVLAVAGRRFHLRDA